MAGFDFMSLLTNPAFQQGMATLGASLDPQGPAGAIGGMTNQWIGVKNKANLLQRLFGGQGQGQGNQSGITGGDVLKLPGGGLASGNPGKLTIDDKGFKLEGGASDLQDLMGEGGITQQQTAKAPIMSKSKSQQAQARQVNPFASGQPNLSISDLAGLTTQDIGQAFQLMLGSQDLSRKNIADMYDAMYKMGTLDVNQQQARTQQSIEQRASAPFIGGYTKTEFKTLPTSEQEYTIYKTSEKRQGRTPTSRREFRTLEPTTREKFLRSALKDPELKSIAKEMAQAGATQLNIGDVQKRAETIADVRSRKFFTDPKGFARDVDKYISSEEVQNELFRLEGPERDRATVQVAEDQGVKLITGAGGVIMNSRLDGRTFVWTVEWPNGETTEVRYAN